MPRSRSRSRTRLALPVLAVALSLGAPAAAGAALPLAAAPGSPFAALDKAEGLGVGDFNGDGRDDVLVGNRDAGQHIGLKLGGPGGVLTDAPKAPFAVGHNLPVAVVAADMNRDGRLDAVSASATGGNAKVAVLLGDGAGGLTPAPGSPYLMNAQGPNEEQQLAVGDVDGDGIPDVVGGAIDKITVLRGLGTGALQPGLTQSAPNGTKIQGVAIGDFDGDGDLDVFTGDEAALYKGVLFEWTGDNLGATKIVPDVGDNPSAGDIDGDGRTDVVGVTTGPSEIKAFGVTGDNVFTPIANDDPGFFFLTSTRLDDLDADGRLDLVIASSDMGLGVLRGSGTGTFASVDGFPMAIGDHNQYATTGDVNGDGQPDVLYSDATNDKVGVLLNGNAGGLAAPAAADLGTAQVGGAPTERTVTLTSTGSGFLAVRSATVAGPDAGDVTKVADGCTGRRIVVGGTCGITVRFAPGAPGARTASLVLSDNGAGGGRAVALGGQATAPPVVVPPKADVTRPVVSALSFAPRTFRVAKAATATSAAAKKKAKKKAPAGTKLRFTLSEAAAVRIAVERATTGRRSGKRCVKETARLRKAKAKRCTRYVRAGTLTRTAKAGRVTVAFSGRIGRRALARGAYRVAITATDAAGNRTAKAATRTFKVVR